MFRVRYAEKQKVRKQREREIAQKSSEKMNC